jgi:hypothetical protein
MTSTPPSAEQIEQMLAHLCAGLPLLRSLASAGGPAVTSALEELVERASKGPVDGAWAHRFVALARRLGVPVALSERSGSESTVRVGGLPNLGDGAPRLDCYACPRARCSRREVRRPGGSVPHCFVLAADLHLGEDVR